MQFWLFSYAFYKFQPIKQIPENLKLEKYQVKSFIPSYTYPSLLHMGPVPVYYIPMTSGTHLFYSSFLLSFPFFFFSLISFFFTESHAAMYRQPLEHCEELGAGLCRGQGGKGSGGKGGGGQGEAKASTN